MRLRLSYRVRRSRSLHEGATPDVTATGARLASDVADAAASDVATDY